MFRSRGGTLRGRSVRRSLATAFLQLSLAACLVVDSVVHLDDAAFYEPVHGALIGEADLFRVQAIVALVIAAVVLVRPGRLAWALAALVSGSAAGAVVLYTYLDVGPLAGLPNLYEPSWGPPGKLASAVAEGAGLLLAVTGLLSSRHRPHAQVPVHGYANLSEHAPGGP
ncbi:hypothetical protein [Leekyejoonella antrihumi]|uniref:Uncharacterized protein n=1 Tax=Leekyejoonella antrihumi TaxID=1660198 RepID=A0A563DP38_9MICO|nr:hypothetical protein [Leekyejoonella antrihumi]TWP31980.1 hypothetical protein FGL98_24910 [Leekyejoonella antrihumi]